MFDIIRFYEDHHVVYSTEGKNCQDGWVNICCPFCEDQSNHLGVEIKKPTKVRCWRCGNHGLLEILEYYSDKKASIIYREYETEEDALEASVVTKKKEGKSYREIENEFYKNTECWTSFYVHYLHDREFNAFTIHNDWGVKAGIESGDYKYRLMIPILHNGQMVSFQGRDITGKQGEKYKTCAGTYINNYLYGLDYIRKDRLIIDEGVTDVWRLGKGNAIATFGINFSTEQIKLIVEKNIKSAIIFFDSEKQAQEQAERLKNSLELFDIKCLNFVIKDKDPASLNKYEVSKVLKLLNNM